MNAICVTCGTQFAESPQVPDRCPICDDARQYVGFEGQQWTTLADLRREHKTKIQHEEPGLISFSIEPKFGIGQRTFLVKMVSGNVLWDCISLFDDAAVDFIRRSGALKAIAISHPHYYTCLVEWSRTFGNIPVYVHWDDREHVMRPDAHIRLWDGETLELPGGLTMIRCGGHFEGACVMHWPAGAEGRGALLTGDTIQVLPDRRFVSFMYSYPNYIPLNTAGVERIVAAVEPFAFDRIYGAFPGLTVRTNGKLAIRQSAERYLKAISTGLRI